MRLYGRMPASEGETLKLSHFDCNISSGPCVKSKIITEELEFFGRFL